MPVNLPSRKRFSDVLRDLNQVNGYFMSVNSYFNILNIERE